MREFFFRRQPVAPGMKTARLRVSFTNAAQESSDDRGARPETMPAEMTDSVRLSRLSLYILIYGRDCFTNQCVSCKSFCAPAGAVLR
jgi:hypothetical protein